MVLNQTITRHCTKAVGMSKIGNCFRKTTVETGSWTESLIPTIRKKTNKPLKHSTEGWKGGRHVMVIQKAKQFLLFEQKRTTQKQRHNNNNPPHKKTKQPGSRKCLHKKDQKIQKVTERTMSDNTNSTTTTTKQQPPRNNNNGHDLKRVLLIIITAI